MLDSVIITIATDNFIKVCAHVLPSGSRFLKGHWQMDNLILHDKYKRAKFLYKE